MNTGLIFLVAYGGGHVAMLAPVASALLAAGRPFTFLALTTARPYLDRMGIPSIGFKDLPGAADVDVQAWGHYLAADLPMGGPVDPEETIAYLGANFRDLVQEVGEEEALEQYRVKGRQSFLPVRTLENAFHALRPSLVVTTNSPRAEQAAILAAGRLGIPSVCAVDLFALQEVQWIGQPGYADRVCVLNESVRQMFLAHGRLSHEVVVTGNPAFDSLNDPKTIADGMLLRRARGWEDGRITVLWASQPEPRRHPFANRHGDPKLPRLIEQELRSFIAKNIGFRLVVRYHPSECMEFAPGKHVHLSPTEESISVLLNAVDAVVITASTVGLQASIVGLPVISVDTSIFTPDAPYSQFGITVGVGCVAALSQALLHIEDHGRDPPQNKPTQSEESATQLLLSVIDSFLN